MNPLLITAGMTAPGIGAVAASTGQAFKELRGLCRTLAGRLHALSKEVPDIELALY